MSASNSDRKVRGNSGKSFKDGPHNQIGKKEIDFIAEIANALKSEFGQSSNGIRRISRLTSVRERTAQNWVEEKNGPNGESLMLLCRHSDKVLETFLALAGRGEIFANKRLRDIKTLLRDTLENLEGFDT